MLDGFAKSLKGVFLNSYKKCYVIYRFVMNLLAGKFKT